MGRGQGHRPWVPRAVLSPESGCRSHTLAFGPPHPGGQHGAVCLWQKAASQSKQAPQADAQASRAHLLLPAPQPLGLTSPSPAQSPPYPRGHASGPQRHLKLQTAPTPSFNEHVSPVMTVAPARVVLAPHVASTWSAYVQGPPLRLDLHFLGLMTNDSEQHLRVSWRSVCLLWGCVCSNILPDFID